MQDMMFAKGVNFNDYPNWFKRGRFIRKETRPTEISKEAWLVIPKQHRPATRWVARSQIVRLDMPRFNSVTNRLNVIFQGASPITESQ